MMKNNKCFTTGELGVIGFEFEKKNAYQNKLDIYLSI